MQPPRKIWQLRKFLSAVGKTISAIQRFSSGERVQRGFSMDSEMYVRKQVQNDIENTTVPLDCRDSFPTLQQQGPRSTFHKEVFLQPHNWRPEFHFVQGLIHSGSTKPVWGWCSSETRWRFDTNLPGQLGWTLLEVKLTVRSRGLCHLPMVLRVFPTAGSGSRWYRTVTRAMSRL